MPRPPSLPNLAAAALVACLAAGQAQAHAHLVKADPAANATVSAPAALHLEFSEELATRFSTFKLTDARGNPVAVMAMPSKDAKALQARPDSRLAPGIYTVSWKAVATGDGHRAAGSYRFTVK
ncbi:MAG TPA: copper homeostasis periplasmic binding protein CopC [Steroidobacteraceae bacterium]|nr:copper homeostasis periplasmic binding protein CopC [Steroidobacteraceae bacterium]